MNYVFKLTRGPRFQIALAVGTAGWLMSWIMVYWGGSMARHLPDQGFHLMAFSGAILAGVMLADGFGRGGAAGWFLSGLWFVLSTVIGAGLGPMIGAFWAYVFTPYTALVLMQGGMELDGLLLFLFGWLAVLDGMTTSPAVVAIWSAGLIGVHLVARRVRETYELEKSTKPF